MDDVKAKIQELVPDVAGSSKTYGLSYPITFAVVLRAIAKTQAGNGEPIIVDAAGQFYDLLEQEYSGRLSNVKAQWNLEQDNYDQQSEECKQFIGNLLGV